MPLNPSLSIERAADLLNVSLPFLLHEAGCGALPLHTANGRLRILLVDFVDFRARLLARQDMAMQELAVQAQELRMGYGDS
jgi:hypothetical protein